MHQAIGCIGNSVHWKGVDTCKDHLQSEAGVKNKEKQCVAPALQRLN